MDDVGFVDAVFAFFGEDAPTDAMLAILKARLETSDKELDEIVPENDADGTDLQYCRDVLQRLTMFRIDPDGCLASTDPDNFFGKMDRESQRYKGLVKIAQAHKERKKTPPVVQRGDLSAITMGTAKLAVGPRVTPKATTPPAVVTAPAPAPATVAPAPLPAAIVPTPAPASTAAPTLVPTTPKALSVVKQVAPAKPTTPPSATGRGPTLGSNPITAEMRSMLGTRDWQIFRGGLIEAFGMFRSNVESEQKQGKARLESARKTILVLKAGQNGRRGKILAALMAHCFNDLNKGIDPDSPTFFGDYYEV